MSAPMLDITRQNQPLMPEIQQAIQQVCETGAFVRGPACTELEERIAEYCGVKHAIGCASGSDALLLAMMALNIGLGDEVILPSFTFFATAGSVWRLGAKPVFADILPDTFNIDPDDIERKITPSTKAILPVHLFGQAAEMDRINDLADRYGLHVIEDAAQAIGATYQGKRVGSLGKFGCFSFYPTKNLGGFGDGGMITTEDTELADHLRIMCDHGQRPRYYHHTVGLNSRLDAVQAAALNVKMNHLDQFAASRERNAREYHARFDELGDNAIVTTPHVAPDMWSVWNQYTVRVTGGHRDAYQKFLASRKIGSAIYYPVPLHLQPCFERLGYQKGDLPHTEKASQEVISLPVFPELTSEEIQSVIRATHDFCDQSSGAPPASEAA